MTESEAKPRGDVRADYERKMAVGVKFDGPPKKRLWGAEEAVFREPDGNEIVLQG